MVDKNTKTLLHKPPEALWAYKITAGIPTHVTPYSLVFSGETLLLLKIQFPSLRVAINEGMINEERFNLFLVELESLDEDRLVT